MTSRKRTRSEVDAEEKRLEDLVFGDGDVTFGAEKEQEESGQSHKEKVKNKPKQKKILKESLDESDSDDEPEQTKKFQDISQLKPAWVDKDDAKISVNLYNSKKRIKLRNSESDESISGKEYTKRLREQRTKILGTADWASEFQDETNDLLRSTKSLVEQQNFDILEPNKILINRLKNANFQGKSTAAVHSVEFHPSGEFIMTAGLDKTIRLFEVDGKNNTKLQSIFLPDFPTRCAHFTADGSEIIATGDNACFYAYDIALAKGEKISTLTGRTHCRKNSKNAAKFQTFSASPDNKYLALLSNETISIISRKSKEWITNFTMNGPAQTISFSHDSRYLYSAGNEGVVYIWDMVARRCVQRYKDHGALHTTVVRNCPRGIYQATGSDNGVLNIYQDPSGFAGVATPSYSPLPFKELLNLTTDITSIAFSHDSQLLAYASSQKRGALRLVHLPSGSVYENWPTEQCHITRVSDLAFSPDSTRLAVGDSHGQVSLWQLQHYNQHKRAQ